MTKIFNFFKTTTGIIILVVIGAGLLIWWLMATYESNLTRAMQRELDDVNARINRATASRGADISSLISEREALIEFIKLKLS